MSGIVDKLTDIVKGIRDIPSKIAELPDKFLDLLKEIFVPDTEEIKGQFNKMIISVENKFGFNTSSIENLKNTWEEKPVENVQTAYYVPGVGHMNIKILDSYYLNKGIEFFRPILRGFIVLLLLFYHYRMVLSFIGQDPGIYASAKESAEK